MIHIVIPQSHRLATSPDGEERPRRLSFYLAMEEFVAKSLRGLDECFFAWQVEPTVIFGRNQLIENEVNIDFCKKRGIDMIRRKSGGGCVYADMNNVMFSYVNSGDRVVFTFEHYIDITVKMLRSLGVDAQSSSRNDIMIEGRKVSGNAFYHTSGRNIVHGTMLYDTDMENMVSAITPSNEKLVSKGIESVRQHICLLKDYIGNKMSVDQFRDYACNYMCDSQYVLTSGDIVEIEEIQKSYHDENYILGHNPEYKLAFHKRIDKVGEFYVSMDLKNDVIRRINMMGDFFVTGDLNELLDRLRGARRRPQDLGEALGGVDVSQIVMGLTNDAFVDLLTQ